MADLMLALRNADAAGDTDAAKRIAEMIRVESAKKQEATSFVDESLGGLDAAASIASGIIAEPVAGLAGIAQSVNPFSESGSGADAVASVRDAMTYQPRTEEGQEKLAAVGEFLEPVGEAMSATEDWLGKSTLEATGSPALAAIAHTLPTAALEAVGVKGLRRSPTASPSLDEIARKKDFVRQGYEPKEFERNVRFSEAKKEQMNKALAGAKDEQLAAMIEADPEFFKALDILDAKQKGLPSAASKNRQYREAEQALKKMPGSELAKKEFDQVSELQQIADDLIKDYDGYLDKSDLSIELLDGSDRAINELTTVTNAAYDNIRDNIPKQTLSGMDNIGQYIKQELNDLGGDVSQLSTLEKRLLAMSESGATYHALDKIRKEVGNTLGKKSNKYADEDNGALKRIYAKLTDDQEVVANNLGMSDAWSGAKELVKQRKALEDKSVVMFGKNLSDAFMPKMGQAIKKLSTGDYKKFNELINAVPANKRQSVVVSALNDALTMGSRKEKQLSVAGYADWYNGLSKNPRLKRELYSEMPEELTKKLDAMGRVTNGIREAQAAAPVGGQVMANSNVFDRVTNGVAKRFLSKLPGIMGDVVEAGLEKGKSKGFDNAMELLGDPDFTSNLKALAEGQARKAEFYERKLLKKKAAKEFINSLPAKEAKAISVLGLASWLSKEEQNQNQNQ